MTYQRLMVLLALAALGCAEAGPAAEVGPEPSDGPDWSAAAALPPSGHRADIYGHGPDLDAVVSRGLQHALVWPVDVSGVLLPYESLSRLLDPDSPDPEIQRAQRFARTALGFGDFDELYDWLGLVRAGTEASGPHSPWPAGVAAGDPLGVGIVRHELGDAITFSCATCHVGSLFGRAVVGMTNKAARANEFFRLAAGFFPEITPELWRRTAQSSDDDLAMLDRAQQAVGAIASQAPQVSGLDTSLAQVGLSLARRAEDPWASRDPALEASPRPNLLEDLVADSKPAVWWTLKYKTRWLSDGSVVSGNPVLTNFLWNEIGRGTDLHELQAWLEDNQAITEELTAAVFATEAPRWVDWFGADSLDEAAARRGEAHFDRVCSRCHGSYEKGWAAADADARDSAARFATVAVRYPSPTPVMDVGTDPQRAAGMAGFADRLNELAISQWMHTVVEVQAGYVPPPLNGVWARYPYLHNQSVPTLCDLLTPAAERTPVFWMGPADDPATDFDAACVGYPTGDAAPAAWKAVSEARFDTARPGLSNAGHDAWLTGPDGRPALDAAARADLIEFLKTL